MRWLRAAATRAAGLFAGRGADADLRDELELHVQLHTEENIRRGMEPTEARRQALVSSGGIATATESVRERRSLPWIETAMADLRYGARSLARSPGFTSVATITLALGIGANTAIFSVVNGVVMRPLPYAEPDRVVEIASIRKARPIAVSGPDFMDWRDQAHTMSGIAAASTSFTILTGSGDPERLRQARVSANTLDVLGIRPIIGRAFAAGEDQIDAPRVAMLGEGIWRRRFGSDSTIVGRTLLFDGMPTMIIGVAPDELRWPGSEDVWMTTRFSQRDLAQAARGARWLSVVGRLAPSATIESANAELEGISRHLEQADPKHNLDIRSRVTPLLASMVGDIQRPLYLLLGAVGFVLLIACANVASLTLARVASRDAEIAVRTALGASRGRIARQILTESLLLAAGGGLAGLLLAYGGVRALVAIAPPGIPRIDNVTLDARVLAFTFALILLTGILFGVIPALQGSAADLQTRLRTAGRGLFGGKGMLASRRTLVIAEMSLAIILLAGAGLLLKSFVLLRSVNPGFRAEQVMTFAVAMPDTKYASPEQQRQFTTSLLGDLRRLPGVTAAAQSFGLPLSGDNLGFTFEVLGRAPGDPTDEPRAQARVVTPDYFSTMGIPLLRGRMFDDSDRDGSRQVVVVSSEVARRFFPNEDPIGKYVQTGWGDHGKRFGGEIIGIVGDVRQVGLERERTTHMYMPYAQWPLNDYDVVIRATTPSAVVFGGARAILKQMDAEIPMNGARTLSSIVDRSLGQRKFYVTLLAGFAAVAMVLAVVGIYGVIAYGVQQRRREIGVRLALGASRSAVIRMVMSEGLRLTAAGVVVGVVGALVLTRLMETLLFQVGVRDPVTFAAVPFALSAAALLACLVPAWSAAGQNPVEAIRTD